MATYNIVMSLSHLSILSNHRTLCINCVNAKFSLNSASAKIATSCVHNAAGQPLDTGPQS